MASAKAVISNSTVSARISGRSQSHCVVPCFMLHSSPAFAPRPSADGPPSRPKLTGGRSATAAADGGDGGGDGGADGGDGGVGGGGDGGYGGGAEGGSRRMRASEVL